MTEPFEIPVKLTTSLKNNWQSTCEFTEQSTITKDFSELLNCRDEVSLDGASFIFGFSIYLASKARTAEALAIFIVLTICFLLVGFFLPISLMFSEDYSLSVLILSSFLLMVVIGLGWLIAFYVNKGLRKAVPFIFEYWGRR